MNSQPTSAEFFELKYRESPDPWDFATSPYERNRYTAILKAISHRQYGRAFEPGCSIGELTAQLAPLCAHIEAIDIAPSAVERARQRCWKLSNVDVNCKRIQEMRFEESLDLIVFCEIGYYFEERELHKTAQRLVEYLGALGVMVAAHWLGRSEDHVLSGDSVHEVLRSVSGIVLEHSERCGEFRLDRWVKP
jgi:SAM-dependent methyltransferase